MFFKKEKRKRKEKSRWLYSIEANTISLKKSHFPHLSKKWRISAAIANSLLFTSTTNACHQRDNYPPINAFHTAMSIPKTKPSTAKTRSTTRARKTSFAQLWRKVEACKIATGEEAYPEEARHGKQNGRRNGPNSKRQKKEADTAIAPTTDTAARMT